MWACSSWESRTQQTFSRRSVVRHVTAAMSCSRLRGNAVGVCHCTQTKASIAPTVRTTPPQCRLHPAAAAALQLKAKDPKLGKQCSLIKTSLDQVYPLLRESNGRLVPLQEEVEAALKVWLRLQDGSTDATAMCIKL